MNQLGYITGFVFFFALFGAGNSLLAEGKPGGKKTARNYRNTPWHLVDTWWDLGKDMPFQSCSVEVHISKDVPSSVNLYIAPIGLGHLSGTPFYGGIQTQADGYKRKDRKLRRIGPGFLMSMWKERSHDAIRPAAGGFCQSSGHEGDFVSVRRPYKWTKGKYTYKIVRMDKQIVKGKPCTWVGAFVYSFAKDENIFVGALRFPSGKLVLKRRIANFVEIYGRRIPVAKIPDVTVTFSAPAVNGKPMSKASAFAVYPERVPDYASAQWKNGKIVVRIGQEMKGRSKRRVWLRR